MEIFIKPTQKFIIIISKQKKGKWFSMKTYKVLILCLSIVIIIASGLVFINKDDKLNNVLKVDNKDSIGQVNDLEKIEGSTITKKFDGIYMSPLVTISEEKPEFDIKLEGLNGEEELILINSFSGEMIKMEYGKDKKYHLNTKLDKDIDYGILLDYRLVGSIRIVEDFKKVNEDEIYAEIMKNLQCGL